ncbi:MAG TPA: DUF305 domain-containing protein [Devosia sp.]|nr:DUF305 domain-containing protein [Devosia sp.]
MKPRALALGLALALAAVAPAVALDLPAICAGQAGGGGMAGMSGMSADQSAPGGAMAAAAPSDQAHRDLMAGMDTMNGQMMQGGAAADIDVAFVCAMMPHHQGAIDMARAELAHGDDPWVKEFAQRVIDAQSAEIAQMQDWLARQPQ